MPRVNRDLQRRLAARRERERRRPTERRYRFSPSVVDDEAAVQGEPEMAVEAAATPAPAPVRRAIAARGTSVKAAPRPFSSYREEYAYVVGDLRRIVVVVGLLLLAIVLLSFVIRT